jgi:hypothetical protein
MKITAIKKNRDEKGSSAEFFGSNSRSNGDLFPRSSLFSLRLMLLILEWLLIIRWLLLLLL